MVDTWEDAVRWYRSTATPADLRFNYMDLPQQGAARRFYASAEFRKTLTLLGLMPGALLDLGAGAGISSVAFALAGWDVTAVEPDPSPVVGAAAIEELAREMGVHVVAVCSAGEDIAVPDSSVDAVYGRQVLHHVTDLDQTMREVYRVLRPGGRAVFVREHVAESDDELMEFLASHPLHARYGGENALPRMTYIASAKRAGLVLRREILPLESIINTFPLSGAQRFRAELALLAKSRGPHDLSMRERILGAGGAGGRLYSFVWAKPGSEGSR